MNSSKAIRQAAIAVATLAAGAAWAHPGHGDPSAVTTFFHLFTEPDHLLMLLVAGVAVFALAPSRRRGPPASKQPKD
jgi:urease accessory protein